jgi:hypothetical protein
MAEGIFRWESIQLRLVVLAPLAFAVFTEPSPAVTGHVRVVFAKAGLIAGESERDRVYP